MAISMTPPALHELRNPTSVEAQITALKQLKNEIIGHDQRKELLIRHGIAAPLVRILISTSRTSGKRKSRDVNGASSGLQKDLPWTQEDEMRLQATIIVGSLAHGGPAFVTPLLAADVLPPLLAAISPSEVPPRLLTASLRTVLDIAKALSLDVESLDSRGSSSALNQVYSKPVIENFAEILSYRSASLKALEQMSLVAELLSTTCRSAYHRAVIAKAGVLDLLAARFAAFSVSEGYLPPDADSSVIATLPPAPPRASLSLILNAICVIIQESAYRTARFLFCPAIVGVFPSSMAQFNPESSLPWLVNNSSQSVTSTDRLLPQIQAVQNKSEHSFSKAFPALGSFVTPGDLSRMPNFADNHTQPSSRTISGDEIGSPIIAWLIYLARTTTGDDRLAATCLLTLIIRAVEQNPLVDPRAESSHRNRDRTLAFLVVPLLVKMIDEATSDPKLLGLDSAHWNTSTRNVLQQAPLLLATLIVESSALQKAAVDAGAIKKICQILKKSFDPVPASSKRMWSPSPLSSVSHDDPEDPSTYLGRIGHSPETVHALKCRAGALKALAAIAHKDDGYRKLIIENGIVACITDSLIPYTDGPVPSGNAATSQTEVPKEGNPVPVIIAACNAARALSRSVNILRTSLIDGGIAKPVFALMQNPNVEVQMAATDVLCNLLLNFSPMREDLIDAGVLKTLCDHAHSADPNMRFISLWALKHLVLTAPNDIKIACLEELGTGWLIQTVTGESREASSTPISMGTPNAAGEQVDLLNAVEVPSLDIEDTSGGSEDEEDDAMMDSIGLLRLPHYSSPQSSSTQHRARLKAIKDAEQNPIVRSQKDDIRTQEQALDFIRNLISEPGSAANEMIDHLFNTLGSTRFFEILTAKLRPKGATSTPQGGKRTATTLPSLSQHLPPPSAGPHAQSPELLQSTIFILIHLANGTSRHRSLVVSQTDLLKAALPHFAHPNARVRVACVWLVNNLTWLDDHSDKMAARQRALELRYLGVEEAVRRLVNDPDLDTRERAKTAVEQMGQLLEGVGGGNGSGGGPSSLGVERRESGLGGPVHRGWER